MKGWIETRTAADGSKRYDACWRVGRQKRSKTFTRRKAADRFLTDTAQKIQAGTYVEIKPTTFGEYATDWLAGLSSVKPSTRLGYSIALTKYLIPSLGKLPLTQIGPEEVNRYLASQEGRQRPKSLVNHLSLLSKILTDAVEGQRLTANRLLRSKAIRRPKAIREDDEITVEVPTHAEVNRILDALPAVWQPFFLTLACTGMRFGEAIALRWCDFDADAGRLAVQRAYYMGEFFLPKTKRSRRLVDIGDQLIAVLGGIRPANVPPKTLIFHRGADAPLVYSTVRDVWLQALEDAGVRHLRIHSLRHFYASAQIALGTNIKYISQQLGHASVQITVDRYGHLFPDEHRVAARRLETMLGWLSSGNHPANQDVNAGPGLIR